MSGAATRRSGGRPTIQAAALLETAILDAATAAFLADGYAATTIEAIARTCGVAKRTIYARWTGKPALFRAVLGRLMARWLSTAGDWAEAETLEAALDQAAERILAVALTPRSGRVASLAHCRERPLSRTAPMMHQAGASEGTARIAALLDQAVDRGTLRKQDTAFAAEQFLHLVLAGPQRRALGLGRPLDPQQTRAWQKAAVQMFLSGIRT